MAQADTIAHDTEKFLKTVAQRFQITILGGGFPVPTGNGKVYNTALLVSPNGEDWRGIKKCTCLM